MKWFVRRTLHQEGIKADKTYQLTSGNGGDQDRGYRFGSLLATRSRLANKPLVLSSRSTANWAGGPSGVLVRLHAASLELSQAIVTGLSMKSVEERVRRHFEKHEHARNGTVSMEEAYKMRRASAGKSIRGFAARSKVFISWLFAFLSRLSLTSQ